MITLLQKAAKIENQVLSIMFHRHSAKRSDLRDHSASAARYSEPGRRHDYGSVAL